MEKGDGLRDKARTFRGRLIYLCFNMISLLGFGLVAVSLLLIATFVVFSLLATDENPYFDIVGYLILPSMLVVGLVIVPIGMLYKQWRWKRSAATAGGSVPYPKIDLNDRSTLGTILIFAGFSFFVVLPLLAVSGYQGYHYTESTEFCGRACHSVMEPEATAHSLSPHARVTCAECHIGAGAGWFVKSKLSGTRQVFAVMFDTYSRPIPPAISELRPARETCEACHWPAQFFGSQYKEVVHFSPDEQNSRHVVRMLLKTGGADESIGRVEGIHMHMLMDGKIEFVATDEGLQDIPWVRYTKADGSEVIYRSDGEGFDQPPPPGLIRRVDCMDCHNRGAHHFRSPERGVDQYLEVGRIDPALPFIKREAVAALTAEFANDAEAHAHIERALSEFYQANYPAVWQNEQPRIQQAIAGAKRIYDLNFFPEMRVDWKTYPENVGHLTSSGCFRCHDGRHVNQHGEVIVSDCTVCHTFLNPIEGQPDAYVEGEFVHSMNLIKHGNLRCDQCHTGGPLPLCRDCHASGDWLEQRGMERFNYTTRPVQPGP